MNQVNYSHLPHHRCTRLLIRYHLVSKSVTATPAAAAVALTGFCTYFLQLKTHFNSSLLRGEKKE